MTPEEELVNDPTFLPESEKADIVTKLKRDHIIKVWVAFFFFLATLVCFVWGIYELVRLVW